MYTELHNYNTSWCNFEEFIARIQGLFKKRKCDYRVIGVSNNFFLMQC